MPGILFKLRAAVRYQTLKLLFFKSTPMLHTKMTLNAAVTVKDRYKFLSFVDNILTFLYRYLKHTHLEVRTKGINVFKSCSVIHFHKFLTHENRVRYGLLAKRLEINPKFLIRCEQTLLKTFHFK